MTLGSLCFQSILFRFIMCYISKGRNKIGDLGFCTVSSIVFGFVRRDRREPVDVQY